MKMRDLATIVRRLGSLVLAIAIVVAPIAPAVAACVSSSATEAMATSTATPCDMPCKDCASKTTKKSCQGECVCVKTLFDHRSALVQRALALHGPMPYKFAPLVATARPPDPPPPRTILV